MRTHDDPIEYVNRVVDSGRLTSTQISPVTQTDDSFVDSQVKSVSGSYSDRIVSEKFVSISDSVVYVISLL